MFTINLDGGTISPLIKDPPLIRGEIIPPNIPLYPDIHLDVEIRPHEPPHDLMYPKTNPLFDADDPNCDDAVVEVKPGYSSVVDYCSAV